MPSIEARLQPASADADASPSRADRKSADAIFLSTANLTSELSRVNSTPLSSDAIDALGLPPSSSCTNDSLNEPSPLTMAPPKPGPADTLYPSPSGGFVPSPEEGQDWRLKPPPPGRARDSTKPSSAISNSAAASPSSSISASRTLSPSAEGSSQHPASGPSSTTPTRPPSLPTCPETASKIANASSSSLSRRSSQASNAVASPQVRPVSSSSSSRHRLSTANLSSQSAPERPACRSVSTASGAHASEVQQSYDTISHCRATSSRPNSTTSFQTARIDDAKDDASLSIRVRDFAFPQDDPRHHGHLLAEAQQSAAQDQDFDEHGQESDADGNEFYIEGAEDENEFDGDEGDNANVAQGVYNVLYAFEPVSEHELAVEPGDLVHVVGSLEGGWAIAIKDGNETVKGLVPATYLEWSAPLPE
ncbi:uncharacterized protein UMAG_11224 [Mycosarcoma maydis]|uniref:SH3 domain-containing protein n=1 Tax=Mycosarcoma maydis TaxID=5270 RepID=A0A0D1DTA0_MYCMD|nr:uncharacterized protein UMAG_11224 [Ustilago maydis 521]KIS65820.1 hypothetical protein UMAG_11224 [Ustilago maydis 521]|eukprot:XP_011392623.1 hypothetical protein UMAG_11224 [Ustilago maydis 521]